MLTLRAPEPEDLNLIYIWENSSEESHSSLRSGPISRHQIRRFIDTYDGEIFSQKSLRFMLDVDNETVGTVDVFDFVPLLHHAFLGIYITPHARRKGIGRQAIAEVERLMVRNVGMYSLAALVADDNIPSQKLFESAGYKKTGCLEGWIIDGPRRIDAIIYQHVL